MNLKEKIVHESLRLFSSKGFCSTSISDILKAADTSKGGFYNHFASKDDLFFAVLAEAQGIWRERTLTNLDEIESPIEKVKMLLINYRDRYLKDSVNFPGGCIFITFSVELDDQRPALSEEVNKGFVGFKAMLQSLLDDAQKAGDLLEGVKTHTVTEILFSGMLGSSVVFGVDKSNPNLDRSINSLLGYIESIQRN